MQIIYFPHTYITDNAFETLSRCFEKIHIYQPTLKHVPERIRQWQKAGCLEIRCPIPELEKDIEASYKAYHHLGSLHRGKKGEMKHFQPAGTPFFEEDSSVRIHAELRRQINGKAMPDETFPDLKTRLVQAGLFLLIAQEFDASQDEIHRGIEICAEIEKSLFKNLKEDDDSLFEELTATRLPPDNSAGDHMLMERVSAWTRLFFHDLTTCGVEVNSGTIPPLFVTSSRSLYEEIISLGSDHDGPFFFNLDKIDQESLSAALAHTAGKRISGSTDGEKDTAGTKSQAGIMVISLPENPLSILAKCAGLKPSDPAIPAWPEPWNITLIGLISS